VVMYSDLRHGNVWIERDCAIEQLEVRWMGR
jgi:hypothetical protein